VPRIVLLGPQRLQPTLAEAVEASGVRGPIVAVTAGWEEREDEIDELRTHLGRRVLNLRLHRRAEEVFEKDGELLDAVRQRRARVREVQNLYRIRLDRAVQALRDVRRHGGPAADLDAAMIAALDDLRRLDAWHLERMREILDGWNARWRPGERKSVAPHRAAIRAIADDAESLAIAGGNVAVLMNRLDLFGVGSIFAEHTLFAWSAGAICATDAVVIYHDDPPQGRGHPEVLRPGLGLLHGVVALPHAHRRIRLDRSNRVRLWHHRFQPKVCLALDDGAFATFEDGKLAAVTAGVKTFTEDGRVIEGVSL
jgi:peptidase E